MQRTLSIIKPDAVKKKLIGKIVSRFEEEGLRIAAIKKLKLSVGEASEFYAIHQDRPFYKELVSFMVSGPIIAIVLEGRDAVAKNREIMGHTDPKEAAENTLRKLYASSIGENAVHGSDSVENANIEISFFFSNVEIK